MAALFLICLVDKNDRMRFVVRFVVVIGKVLRMVDEMIVVFPWKSPTVVEMRFQDVLATVGRF